MNISSLRKISNGFKLGFAALIFLIVFAIGLLALNAAEVITETSDLFSIFNAGRLVLPILSMVLIINGIVELQSDESYIVRAKQWFMLRLILSALVMIISVFSNDIMDRFFSDETDPLYVAIMVVYVVITSIGGYVMNFFSYYYLMRAYGRDVEIYGLDDKLKHKIKRSEKLLTATNLTLVVSELGLLVYVCIVLSRGTVDDVNRGIVRIVALIMIVAIIVRTVNYIFMMNISGRIAQDIEEISR